MTCHPRVLLFMPRAAQAAAAPATTETPASLLSLRIVLLTSLDRIQGWMRVRLSPILEVIRVCHVSFGVLER